MYVKAMAGTNETYTLVKPIFISPKLRKAFYELMLESYKLLDSPYPIVGFTLSYSFLNKLNV